MPAALKNDYSIGKCLSSALVQALAYQIGIKLDYSASSAHKSGAYVVGSSDQLLFGGPPRRRWLMQLYLRDHYTSHEKRLAIHRLRAEKSVVSNACRNWAEKKAKILSPILMWWTP